MYCIKCGVKLEDTSCQCPLCGMELPPLEPNGPEDDLYPRKKYPVAQPRGFAGQVILTALFLLPALIILVCDTQITGAITWSGYVIGALFVSYIALALPLWFRKRNPVIFVPCSFAAVIAYLLYINLAMGDRWFLSFAFPVAGGIGLIVTAVVALVRYIRRGFLYIYGGAFIALGAFMLLTEFLMTITFGFAKFIGWSFYPLITLGLLGCVLIFLAICRPARESVERKIFL